MHDLQWYCKDGPTWQARISSMSFLCHCGCPLCLCHLPYVYSCFSEFVWFIKNTHIPFCICCINLYTTLYSKCSHNPPHDVFFHSHNVTLSAQVKILLRTRNNHIYTIYTTRWSTWWWYLRYLHYQVICVMMLLWYAWKQSFLWRHRGTSQKVHFYDVSTAHPFAVLQPYCERWQHTLGLPSVFTSLWWLMVAMAIGASGTALLWPIACFLLVNPAQSCSATSYLVADCYPGKFGTCPCRQ